MKTTDIGLAAALVAAGYKIATIQSDGTKGIFCFDDDSFGIDPMPLAQAVEAYWEGTLMVSARKLFEGIKVIKGRVRSL